ncbi:ethylene-responsive transcription factor ERF036-like [Miscanthus floridulus]|uniref:ethylene-responsive transcription factor ERF036-like n=1 Tax=Miscanthus floridulus TaxID=154761 RepID=UPI00345781CB
MPDREESRSPASSGASSSGPPLSPAETAARRSSPGCEKRARERDGGKHPSYRGVRMRAWGKWVSEIRELLVPLGTAPFSFHDDATQASWRDSEWIDQDAMAAAHDADELFGFAPDGDHGWGQPVHNHSVA